MFGRKTKAVLGLALAGLVAGAALTPGALAAESDGPGTDVWLSVVPRPGDTRVSVTVPTAIGFVVVGSSDTTATGAITVEEGNLLLPNVKVQSDGAGGHEIAVTGESTLRLENYSTDVPEDQMNQPEESRQRIGLAVDVSAKIVSQNQGGWTLTADAPGQTTDDVKKFQVSMGVNQSLSVFNKPEADGALGLSQSFTLPKPPVEETGWTTAGVSQVPSRTELLLDIKVGGTKGMYNTTEDSVKAAQIVWDITPIYESSTP